jgi:broad specificity phosphatase PhoE
MKLTLLRHGETEENLNHIIQGQSAGHLSELGKKQVEKVADELKSRHFDVIYSSDLARCVDTAEPIHKIFPKTPLIYSKAIREVSFGKFEGRHTHFIKLARLGTMLNLKVPGGENWHDLKRRVIPFLNELYSKYPGGDILIISHGGPIRVMISLLHKSLDKSPHALIIPNCSTWDLEMDQPIEFEK